MDKEYIVLNTLVFLKDLQAGINQSLLMKKVNKLGIKNIEVRREYINDFESELKDIRQQAEKYGMNVFYSVPKVLYRENKLLKQELEKYLNEAKIMGCKNIKLNIGDFKHINCEDANIIRNLCDMYGVHITVENDQTIENGSCDKIYRFLSIMKELNSNITFTFDIGNWIFQNEDSFENAKVLRTFVTYIHLKDLDEAKKTVLLDGGSLNWKRILKVLPNNVPIALEYPCNTLEEIATEIQKLMVL